MKLALDYVFHMHVRHVHKCIWAAQEVISLLHNFYKYIQKSIINETRLKTGSEYLKVVKPPEAHNGPINATFVPIVLK